MARKDDILDAVQRVVAEHERFTDQQGGDPYPPQSFDDAVRLMINVSQGGDWPQECISLCKAIDEFDVVWNQYADGDWQPDGSPKGIVWQKLGNVISEFVGTSKPEVNKLESVSVLLDQMKDWTGRYLHVARVYGWRERMPGGKHKWVGPFFTANETPDVEKIEQERREPGSVLGDDWVAPNERERVERETEALRTKLDRIERRAQSSTFQKDPASIEEQLREGQYADVIAKGQGVTEEEVRRIAAELGITPNERVNLKTYTPPSDEPVPQTSDEVTTDDAVSDDEPTTEDIRAAVLEAYEEDDSLGSAEIVGKVRDEYGYEVTARQVAAYIRQHNKAAATAE